MKDSHIGTCHLCGKEKELTFEHVPPNATFNNESLKCYNGIEVLKSNSKIDPANHPKYRYKQAQRGSGGYYLCKECNNFIGDKYNKEYVEFVKTLAGCLMRNSSIKNISIQFDTKPLLVSAIIKQIMAMFCDISEPCFNDSQLRCYILNENCGDFNFNRYRIFCYAVNTESMGIKHLIDKIEIGKGFSFDKIILSEIAAFPISFILFIDKEESMLDHIDNEDDTKNIKIKACDITDLAKYKNKVAFTTIFNIYNLQDNIPFYLRD